MCNYKYKCKLELQAVMNGGQASSRDSAPTKAGPEGRLAWGEHRDAGGRLACGIVIVCIMCGSILYVI